MQVMEFLELVSGVTLAGLGLGCTRVRWHAAPLVASAAVLGAYAVAMMALGIDRALDRWIEDAILAGVASILALLGIWVGAAITTGMRWPIAALRASTVVVAVYAIAMAAMAIWAASCPNCNSGEFDRTGRAATGGLVFGAATIAVLLTVWIGAAMAGLFAWLFGSRVKLRG